MNCSEEEIAGLAQLIFDTRQRNVSTPLAILSPNYSSSMARIAKSLPIAIRVSPSKDQENTKEGRELGTSPGTPSVVKEIKRNRSMSSTPRTPNPSAVKIVKFSVSKASSEVFLREDFDSKKRQKPTSALKELFKSPGASSPSVWLLVISVNKEYAVLHSTVPL